jgi:hypothetical protein
MTVNYSLEKTINEMVEKTVEFAKENKIDEMKRVKLNRASSTVEIENALGEVKRFAVVFIGIVDNEDKLFVWGDALSELSEYSRNECTELRDIMESRMLLEATHYSLRITPETVQEARECYDDGDRYIIDDGDALLSRFNVDELFSLIFANTTLSAMYNVSVDKLTYYFGIKASLS